MVVSWGTYSPPLGSTDKDGTGLGWWWDQDWEVEETKSREWGPWGTDPLCKYDSGSFMITDVDDKREASTIVVIPNCVGER